MTLSRKDILFWAIFAIFVALQLWQHLSASFAMPTPWPDESHFLWQAVAFEESGSLLAPQLNPERSVFWMPPGFMIAVGLWLKIFGLSLGVARSFSFVMLVLSFLALAALIKHQRLPLLSLILAGAVYLNGPFAACGNIARPETMLLFFTLSGFLLIHHRQSWKGMLLLVLTPLIHPNGLYFAAGAILYVGISHRLFANIKKMSKSDVVSLLIVVALWVAYLLYVVNNWSHFVHDLDFQLARKSERDIQGRLLNLESVLTFLVLALASVYLARKKINWALLIAIGVPAWLTYKIGFEMWYDVFQGIAWICFSLIILYAAYHMTIKRAIVGHASVNWSLFVAVAILVAFWNYHSNTIPPVHAYPDRMAWHGLRFPGDVPYITDNDRETVARLIDSLCFVDNLKTIQFLPRTDVFLFPKMVGNRRLLVSHPLFYQRTPDLYIIHRSRYQPLKWGIFEVEDLKEIFGVNDLARFSQQQVEAIVPFMFRDNSEIWFYLIPGKLPGNTETSDPDSVVSTPAEP